DPGDRDWQRRRIGRHRRSWPARPQHVADETDRAECEPEQSDQRQRQHATRTAAPAARACPEPARPAELGRPHALAVWDPRISAASMARPARAAWASDAVDVND